ASSGSAEFLLPSTSTAPEMRWPPSINRVDIYMIVRRSAFGAATPRSSGALRLAAHPEPVEVAQPFRAARRRSAGLKACATTGGRQSVRGPWSVPSHEVAEQDDLLPKLHPEAIADDGPAPIDQRLDLGGRCRAFV